MSCGSSNAVQKAMETSSSGSTSAGEESSSAGIETGDQEGTETGDPACNIDKNEVNGDYGLDAPDDTFVIAGSAAELSLTSDECTVTAVGSASIEFECTYAEPPTPRHYSLTLDLHPAPASPLFDVGASLALRLHFFSLFESASFQWVRLEQRGEPVLVALKLGEVWQDDSLPTIVSDAFGDLARETDTELCRTSVSEGAGTRTDETMEFSSSSGWVEVRHDEHVALENSLVWIGEAHFRQNTGDTGKYRRRELVVLRSPS